MRKKRDSLGASFGYLTRPADQPTRKLPTAPQKRSSEEATLTAWACPACGRKTDTGDDHARHMTEEYSALVKKLNAIRDLAGRELPAPEDLPKPPSNEITTEEAAAIYGCTDRNIRVMCAKGKLKKWSRVHARMIVVDRDEVIEAARQRYETRPEVARLAAG